MGWDYTVLMGNDIYCEEKLVFGFMCDDKLIAFIKQFNCQLMIATTSFCVYRWITLQENWL